MWRLSVNSRAWSGDTERAEVPNLKTPEIQAVGNRQQLDPLIIARGIVQLIDGDNLGVRGEGEHPYKEERRRNDLAARYRCPSIRSPVAEKPVLKIMICVMRCNYGGKHSRSKFCSRGLEFLIFPLYECVPC